MKTRFYLAITSAIFVAAANNDAQPIITAKPTNQSVSLGASTSFHVSADTIDPPLQYQWRHASTDLPAATDSSLVKLMLRVKCAEDENLSSKAFLKEIWE
jgi:hypothetical protein